MADFKTSIDIRDFENTAVYPWLVMTANAHKTAWEIKLFLGKGMTQRPLRWIEKRRWMCQPNGAPNYKGRPADYHGDQAKAVAIMRDNPTLSLRDLSRLLKERGIKRGREWVRKHRCD